MYTKNELRTLAEIALMGLVVKVNTEDDVTFIFDIIRGAVGTEGMTAEEMYKDAVKYINFDETEIYGLSASTVCGMPCINVLFRDKDCENFAVDGTDGVFCYVLNLADSDCSEYGYSFFEKKGSSYHRIA